MGLCFLTLKDLIKSRLGNGMYFCKIELWTKSGNVAILCLKIPPLEKL